MFAKRHSHLPNQVSTTAGGHSTKVSLIACHSSTKAWSTEPDTSSPSSSRPLFACRSAQHCVTCFGSEATEGRQSTIHVLASQVPNINPLASVVPFEPELVPMSFAGPMGFLQAAGAIQASLTVRCSLIDILLARCQLRLVLNFLTLSLSGTRALSHSVCRR